MVKTKKILGFEENPEKSEEDPGTGCNSGKEVKSSLKLKSYQICVLIRVAERSYLRMKRILTQRKDNSQKLLQELPYSGALPTVY